MKSKFLVLLAILAVMCWVSGAQASALLTLNDGAGHTASITDNLAGVDLNPAVGTILYSGSLGVWSINTTTGFSESPVPHLDLNSFDQSTGAGNLTITLTDTGFKGGSFAIMGIGGTQDNGTVDFTAKVGATTIASLMGLTPDQFNAFKSGFSGPISSSDPTSLTEIVTLHHTGEGHTSFDASLDTTVPVPPGVLLLGSGLLGLVGLRRFRKS